MNMKLCNYERPSLGKQGFGACLTALMMLLSLSNLNASTRSGVEKSAEISTDGVVETTLLAQDKIVSGKVTDADGMPLPAVNILVVGTSNGTATDFDGNYSISASEGDVLEFSFLGMKTVTMTVGADSTVNVSMEEDANALDEVLVTALGIERSKASLAYSVTKVDGEEFTEARETNIANSLAGKVAGVNVSNTVTGPAGTTRVIIRGNTSLTGNNQPLYVIDGIPIDNTNRGSAGMWGGSDGGDGIGNVNPDDIESMTVLKGNTAGALYGSRAANGVIIITTKKGARESGLSIELNSNYVFETAINHLDPQKQYGHGFKNEKPETQQIAWDAGESSWGAPLDGSSVIQWDGEMRPYSVSGNNFDKFYRTGSTFTNTLALSGGTQQLGYRFAMSNLENESIMPNSGMRRNNYSVNLHGKALNDKFSFNASGQYIQQRVWNQPGLADSPANANYTVWQLPVTTDVTDLIGDPDAPGSHPETGMELLPSSSIWFQNPYWAAYQQTRGYSTNRIIGSVTMEYEINEWAYIRARGGLDQSNRYNRSINPTGTGYAPDGGMSESQERLQETNFDVMIGSRHEFDNGLAYDFLAGANSMQREFIGTYASASNFALPFFYSMSNGITNSGSAGYSLLGTNSVYGQLELSWNNWLFLTGSGRNDWFSTLNGRDVFYPSVGASAVLTEVIDMGTVIDYLKVRGSWAQVGDGISTPYGLNQFYSLGTAHYGVAQGGIANGNVANQNLVPLVVTELELGFNMNFFSNRLGVDFAWYDRKTEDDILNATISQTSGYNGATVNIGEVTNTGIELLLTGTPVLNDNFRWDVSFNLGHNESKVVSLLDPEIDNEVLNLARSRSLNTWVQHIEGMPYGQLSGFQYLRDANGEIMHDANGFPMQDTDAGFVPFGTGVHPTTWGLQNNFSYRNWRLGILVDGKNGGIIHSGTNGQLYRRGVHKNTLVGRDTGIGVIPAEEVSQYYTHIFNNISEEFIYDASFVKLREINLGFDFPRSMLENNFLDAVSISFVGRNLWVISSHVDNIDPESTYNAGNAQGLEFLSLPQSRSYGFNVNLKF